MSPSPRSSQPVELWKAPFEARVDRYRDNEVVLEVWQQPLNGERAAGGTPRRVGRLYGAALHIVWDQLLILLRRGRVRAELLSPTRRERRARLPEEVGVRLALLTAALGPLRKYQRIERIAAAVAEMSYEEVCYWYAQVRGEEGRRALRALRLLLAEE